MKHAILNYMIKQRDGYYLHVLEVHNVHELSIVIESFIDELENYFNKQDIKEFFNTMEIYHIYDDELTDLQNEFEGNVLNEFNIDSFIDELL